MTAEEHNAIQKYARQGYLQSWIARRMSCTPKAVSLIVRGISKPSIAGKQVREVDDAAVAKMRKMLEGGETAMVVAKVLDVSVSTVHRVQREVQL